MDKFRNGVQSRYERKYIWKYASEVPKCLNVWSLSEPSVVGRDGVEAAIGWGGLMNDSYQYITSDQACFLHETKKGFAAKSTELGSLGGLKRWHTVLNHHLLFRHKREVYLRYMAYIHFFSRSARVCVKSVCVVSVYMSSGWGSRYGLVWNIRVCNLTQI